MSEWKPKTGEKCLWGGCDTMEFVVVCTHGDVTLVFDTTRGYHYIPLTSSLRPLTQYPPVKDEDCEARPLHVLIEDLRRIIDRPSGYETKGSEALESIVASLEVIQKVLTTGRW